MSIQNDVFDNIQISLSIRITYIRQLAKFSNNTNNQKDFILLQKNKQSLINFLKISRFENYLKMADLLKLFFKV
jgi:hypothetical protein